MKVRVFSAGEFAENTYLVTVDDDGGAAVIDPGAGASEMMEVVRADGLDVVAVLLTHAHLDHVEGLSVVLDAAEAPVYLHPDGRPLYDALPDQARSFGVEAPELPPPDRELAAGDTLELGDCAFRVRNVPGHAPGHVLFWEKDRETAFVGDVVFRGSIGRTDLPGGDFQQLMASIKEQVLTLPDETRLLTGHGRETTVGAEREGNPFLIPHYGGELA